MRESGDGGDTVDRWERREEINRIKMIYVCVSITNDNVFVTQQTYTDKIFKKQKVGKNTQSNYISKGTSQKR